MRDQYAGDISDYLKFAFLRAVAGGYEKLGMAWYYLPGHDGRPDGQHREYLEQPVWAALDDPLHLALQNLPQRTVASLESLKIWPKATSFHRAPVGAPTRPEWVESMVADLDESDLIFLDPDNGLGQHRNKHAHVADLMALQRPRRAMAIIKFPGRNMSHAMQISSLHQQLFDAGFREPITLSTCVSIVGQNGRTVPRHRFFTLVDGTNQARQRVSAFAARLNSLPPAARVSAHCVI
ncbi:MAG: hypothetical protein ACK6A7_23835 [Planctomycetota bacterium]